MAKKKRNTGIFYLPVEQAVYVPSTTVNQKLISMKARKKRVAEVKKYLSTRFGGYTSVSSQGGYYSTDRKKLIQEPVAVVTSFAKTKDYRDHIKELKKQLRVWKKRWHQESMGYSHEGDLYYFS